MGSTANEDKKTLAMLENKTRNLQAKVSALLAIEKDLRACVEQLQTSEKEMQSLEAVQKELADTRDSLDQKKIERTELELRAEVRVPLPLTYPPLIVGVWIARGEAAVKRPREG